MIEKLPWPFEGTVQTFTDNKTTVRQTTKFAVRIVFCRSEGLVVYGLGSAGG